MPTVSVVIPTFNRPGYLRGAIETAINQTFDDLEVVVVDDGSDSDYADRYCTEYDSVSLFKHERNRGLSAARNTGIENASGEYIAFLDDDDRWHREKISKQVTRLDNNPSVGIASCLLCAVSDTGELIRAERGRPSGQLTKDLLVSNVVGTPSRVLIRRECFEEEGTFDESLATKQDWDLYLRMSYDWTVDVVENHLCYRTIHESMSSSPESIRDDRAAVIDKHIDDIERWGNLEATMTDYYRSVGRTYLSTGDSAHSREYLGKSLIEQPTPGAALLYGLTYIPKTAVDVIVSIKRRVELEKNPPDTSPEGVPGLISEGS